MQTTERFNFGYRTEIDGLRAIAVVAVILNHFNFQPLASGYLGVDIFFVVSGYVITSSLFNKRNLEIGLFLRDFYDRRMRRLMPALAACVLLTSVLISICNPSPADALKTGIAALFGFSNLRLYAESANYFSESVDLNPFTHTWSLGVEEQFYLIYPFLFWLAFRKKDQRKGGHRLFMMLAILSAASLLSFVQFYFANKQSEYYYLMPSRFWEMAAGGLVFLGLKNDMFCATKISSIPATPVLILLVLVMLLPLKMALPATLTVVILASLLLVCLTSDKWILGLLVQPNMVYLGKISYSLYLWHWAVLAVSRWTIGVTIWTIPIQICIMLILSIVSYKYLECPIRYGLHGDNKILGLPLPFAITVISAISIGFLNSSLHKYLYAGKNKDILDSRWRRSVNLQNTQINGSLCHSDNSYSDQQTNRLFKLCRYPYRDPLNKSTIAIVGDSHALTLLEAEELFLDSGLGVFHFSRNSCPFPRPSYGIHPDDCDQFLIKAEQKLLQNLGKGDYVIVFNYLLSHLGDRSMLDTRDIYLNKIGQVVSDGSQKEKLFVESIKRFSTLAERKGIKIILIGAGPRNPWRIVSHVEWFRPSPSARFLSAEVLHAKSLNSRLLYHLRDVKNLYFVDLLDVLSRGANYENENFLVDYRDTDHLSTTGASLLVRHLIQAMDMPKLR